VHDADEHRADTGAGCREDRGRGGRAEAGSDFIHVYGEARDFIENLERRKNMRIISWNCNGGYGKKIDKILELDPDIAVIQECESLERLRSSCRDKIPSKSFWFSESDKNKGVGIFFHSEFGIFSMEHYSFIEFVIPMKIKKDFEFYLFSVWAMAPKEKGKTYTFQIERALKRYKDILANNHSIFIGDFNSPHIEKPVEKTEFMVVDEFEKLGIFSAYHKFHKKEYGEHSHHTFYWNKKKDFTHMLDYCFASKAIIDGVRNVEVGTYEDWIEFSDHCPLVVDIEEGLS